MRSGSNVAIPLVIAMWSFIWTYLAGHRGIYPFDQSMVFDGAWRILCGQVPYKDFLMAFTPLTFGIQAAFFQVFGVSWTAYVISGAVLAAVSALSVIRTMLLLVGREGRGLTLAVGFLVGTFFQAIFGTLWIENVSLFFLLLGLQAVAESIHSTALWKRRWWFFVAGLAAGLAFLSKQNVGALVILFLGAAILVVSLPHRNEIAMCLLLFFVGVTLVAIVFVCWLCLASDVALFLRHAIEVPSQIGRERLGRRQNIFLPYMLASVPRFSQWAFVLAIGSFLLAVCRGIWDSEFRREQLACPQAILCIFLAGATPVFHALIQTLTMNQHYNLLFLSALSLGFALRLMRLQSLPRNGLYQWSLLMGWGIGVCLLVEGMFAGAWLRRQHDCFPDQPIAYRNIQIPSLSRVQWLRTTSVGQSEIRLEDLEAVYAYLRAAQEPFFILGDCSFLYGALRTAPPHPLLYFQRKHYYTAEDAARLDNWLLRSLQQRQVKIIVREAVIQSEDVAEVFPLTLQWISEHFTDGPPFGHFQILVRR